METLTDETEDEAYAYFRQIEDLGGVIPAIEDGFFQREIADAAFRYQREIDDARADDRRRQRLRDGRAAGDPDPGHGPAGLRAPGRAPATTSAATRDNRETARYAEGAAKARCGGGENVMPYLLDAVNAYATLQECCDVMREVFGAYQEARLVGVAVTGGRHAARRFPKAAKSAIV